MVGGVLFPPIMGSFMVVFCVENYYEKTTLVSLVSIPHDSFTLVKTEMNSFQLSC